jgi:L-seryl-tRNA(Ser) seleniumtransferase
MARKPALEKLPAVETVLRHPALAAPLAALPRPLVVESVRAVIAEARAGMRSAPSAEPPAADRLAERAALRARGAAEPALRRVLNATGIVLHTNLGRAPYAASARAAVASVAAGYSSVEFDLRAGRRRERGTGVERWLTRITGAEGAVVVNNGAGAVLLALSAVAAGRGVVVSRGELVEIGGSFRVPEVMEKSGARLIEVGATNRTHLRDYERAFAKEGADIGAILRVHRSNFRMEGFTKQPEIAALAALARKHRVPLVEDLGSGALADVAAFGLEHEPTVAESLAQGVDLVTFSGDKLLGASQAGMVLGREAWVKKLRKDPLARALRLDKLALAALEATLPLYLDPERAVREIPALAMLAASREVLLLRAQRLKAALEKAIPGIEAVLAEGHGEVGGGALPLQKLPGPVVDVRVPGLTARALEAAARAADPPVIGVIRQDRVRLDPRTLTDAEVEELAKALASSLAKSG